VVATYPFDDSSSHIQSGWKSVAPDDQVFQHLAHLYADNHATMHLGNICPGDDFLGGVTNGAQWYDVPGGMEDFNYLHSNCFEITMELSCCKYPMGRELTKEWKNNKESMLQFMEATHMGVKGLVKDAAGDPVEDAVVVVQGIRHNVITTKHPTCRNPCSQQRRCRATVRLQGRFWPCSPAVLISNTLKKVTV
jgi:carboxypeptidase D